eukprot:CAMPEP_0114248924 /NCGR_PEP_ID=MMETSP0058-20121206/13844_1 /TAXON_ID=36894 /ORGANISM="Pyramimonas parkeae, CCMP726" /LENGTH=216 /DNA_ID=CAMNT_0001362387 /DNA_START=204 /DNA_END=854 /DNA_ORIENTATION=+
MSSRRHLLVAKATGEADAEESLLDYYSGVGKQLEQPAWSYVDEGLIDINADARLARAYGEILRRRIPLNAIMADVSTTNMSLPAYLALLVGVSNARHWEAARELYNYMLDNPTEEIPTGFFLHLAAKRMDDNQLLPALEALTWLKNERRPPSSHALEMFARISGRCSLNQRGCEDYINLYEWFYDSDVGRALWHVYMGGENRNPDTKVSDKQDSSH